MEQIVCVAMNYCGFESMKKKESHRSRNNVNIRISVLQLSFPRVDTMTFSLFPLLLKSAISPLSLFLFNKLKKWRGADELAFDVEGLVKALMALKGLNLLDGGAVHMRKS